MITTIWACRGCSSTTRCDDDGMFITCDSIGRVLFFSPFISSFFLMMNNCVKEAFISLAIFIDLLDNCKDYCKALFTKLCSSLATSALKVSTCSQQSKGLRSFNLKQCTKFCFAASSSLFSGPPPIILRRSSLERRSLTSFETLWLLSESFFLSLLVEEFDEKAEESFCVMLGEEESEESESEESEESEEVSCWVYWARRAASWSRMRSSSLVTRCWIRSSWVRWRVESDCFVLSFL
jgi:hypothetical protein